MNKQEFYNKTKCPFCKIGFPASYGTKKQLTHLDIMWSQEAGQAFTCQDPETFEQIKDTVDDIFLELNDDFHKDPSVHSKENLNLHDFFALLGEFLRYSGYMDNRDLVDDPEAVQETAMSMYNGGKNMKEVIDATTKEVSDPGE